MKIRCNNLEDTKKLATKFADLISDGCFVNLYGELGAGKTAFVKSVAEALGVKEVVTSPSFVILNEYHSAKIPVYHFDLYRLESNGTDTIYEELQEYCEGKFITFVEWAEFANDTNPLERLEINITYGKSDTERIFRFRAYGDKAARILKGLEDEFISV